MKCVILAGGSGDRLWPLSRKNYPKQFISNNDSLSVFQETITRNIPFCDEFIVITNAKYETIVAGQMQHFQGINYRIFLEDKGLGTAGAIGLLTAFLPEDEQVMVVPSDLVFGHDGYSDAVYAAKDLAIEGNIALLGATPTNASTDFGYIQHEGRRVTRFIEKPSAELAEKLFWNADILWNCGLVCSTVALIKAEMNKYSSGLLAQVNEAYDKGELSCDGNYIVDDSEVKKAGFDRTILEQSEKLSVVRVHCDWHDVSDFGTYEDMYQTDASNVIIANSEETSVINKASGQLVVANELSNVLVVNTPDAVYITDKNKADSIKKIIDNNYSEKKHYFEESPLVYRPWGTRQLIQMADGYRVRKLVIYPGMVMSSHSHENRNESYTVVSGVLTMKTSKELVELNPRECYNVTPGMTHQLGNNTDEEVVVIEVDTGKLIDEADMIADVKAGVAGLNASASSEIATGEIGQGGPQLLPSLYKLDPAFKDYLWGGNTLVEKYGKASTYDITAESWELSAHPDGSSIINGGIFDNMTFANFIKTYGDKVCGWKSKTFDRFPVLIKFIDARNALSVQIHPDDDYAFANENEFGKNEMWYVMDCKPDSFLYCGLSRECSKEEIRERIANETLTEVLNEIKVKPGDVVFVPAGTIHAIGAGILICEIQQNSNCTYRMYDYGRRDKNGNLRELHVDKAMDVVNIDPYMPDTSGFGDDVQYENSLQRVLSRCKYFQVTDYKIPEHEIIQVDESSFKSIVVLSGECTIRCKDEEFQAKAGDSFFISAGRKRVHVEGDCEIVVTNI